MDILYNMVPDQLKISGMKGVENGIGGVADSLIRMFSGQQRTTSTSFSTTTGFIGLDNSVISNDIGNNSISALGGSI